MRQYGMVRTHITDQTGNSLWVDQHGTAVSSSSITCMASYATDQNWLSVIRGTTPRHHRLTRMISCTALKNVADSDHEMSWINFIQGETGT